MKHGPLLERGVRKGVDHFGRNIVARHRRRWTINVKKIFHAKTDHCRCHTIFVLTWTTELCFAIVRVILKDSLVGHLVGQ